MATPAQEGQAIQRRAVCPVHILNQQPHLGPGPRCHRGQQLRHPGEQPFPAPVAIPATGDRLTAGVSPRDQPPHLRPDILRRGIQRRRQQPPAVQPAQLAQRLRYRQQRQRASQRPALSPRPPPTPPAAPGHTPPPAAARASPSATNRVLPTPASPTTSTSPAPPPSASSNRDNSSSRPATPPSPTCAQPTSLRPAGQIHSTLLGWSYRPRGSD